MLTTVEAHDTQTTTATKQLRYGHVNSQHKQFALSHSHLLLSGK